MTILTDSKNGNGAFQRSLRAGPRFGSRLGMAVRTVSCEQAAKGERMGTAGQL